MGADYDFAYAKHYTEQAMYWARSKLGTGATLEEVTTLARLLLEQLGRERSLPLKVRCQRTNQPIPED
jgi:hypothetical protein